MDDVRPVVAFGAELGVIGNSRRLCSGARWTTSRRAFGPQSPMETVGQPTVISTQGRQAAGLAAGERRSIQSAPRPHRGPDREFAPPW